ncbi:MAG: hypothetical protein JSR11_02530 [Bacteroidetes bacterium]|nr:hypothetical protein [Bacteroidota bacterium]
MTITNTQNKQLHSLLNATKMVKQKANLVLGYTNDRTESSREMNVYEAQQLINYLKTLDTTVEQANTMRRKILSMCHRIKWENEDGSVDMIRLNNWCIENSYLKKELNNYTYKELPTLVSTFQKVYRFYMQKISA